MKKTSARKRTAGSAWAHEAVGSLKKPLAKMGSELEEIAAMHYYLYEVVGALEDLRGPLNSLAQDVNLLRRAFVDDATLLRAVRPAEPGGGAISTGSSPMTARQPPRALRFPGSKKNPDKNVGR